MLSGSDPWLVEQAALGETVTVEIDAAAYIRTCRPRVAGSTDAGARRAPGAAGAPHPAASSWRWSPDIAAGIGSARSYRAQPARAEELAELDRAKTAFFFNVSHEFRTPLTLILDPVAELRGRSAELDERAHEDLDPVWRNDLWLAKLVNTLVDFSRIEAGRMQASYVPVGPGALTAELASLSGRRSSIRG